MLTNSKLVKTLVLATVFGTVGTIEASVIPTSLGATITQQKSKVAGFVEDEMGPVAGASISIKGTSNGTITDMDGKFELDGVQKWECSCHFICRITDTGNYMERTKFDKSKIA